MNQEIQTALQKLQSQLELLEPAAYNINEYDRVSKKAISSLEQLDKYYQEHLSGVKQSIATFLLSLNTENGSHIADIRTEFAEILRGISNESDKNLKGLDEAKKNLLTFLPQLARENELHLTKVKNEYSETLKRITAEINTAIEEFKLTLSKSTALINAVERFTEKIDKVDFPSRLDKIDNSVSNIYTGVQNLQGRIDLLEMNLKEHLQNKINDIVQHLELQKSRQNRGLMLNYIIVILLIVLIGLAFWNIKLKS
jgi:hypothetical protein